VKSRKFDLQPWVRSRTLTPVERWGLAKGLMDRIKDAPPGSYLTVIEGDTMIFAVIDDQGRIRVYDTCVRASNGPGPAERVVLTSGEPAVVNTFSRKTNRA
jgi:hypothetical protein